MSRRLKIAMLTTAFVLVFVSVVLEIVVPDAHLDDPAWTVLWWQDKPGFHGLLGFVGCLLIVWVSKALGKVWLQRDEGYYDE